MKFWLYTHILTWSQLVVRHQPCMGIFRINIPQLMWWHGSNKTIDTFRKYSDGSSWQFWESLGGGGGGSQYKDVVLPVRRSLRAIPMPGKTVFILRQDTQINDSQRNFERIIPDFVVSNMPADGKAQPGIVQFCDMQWRSYSEIRKLDLTLGSSLISTAWSKLCDWFQQLGADSIKRCHLTSIGNPIVEIRQSYDRLISTMGFPIPVRWHLYIESGTWSRVTVTLLLNHWP